LALLQGLLGHASSLTTSRYAHLQTDTLRAEADGIAASIAAVLKASKRAETKHRSDI
jgi:hypothetical protein